jgi:uncharacterized protein (TIGR03435 family)
MMKRTVLTAACSLVVSACAFTQLAGAQPAPPPPPPPPPSGIAPPPAVPGAQAVDPNATFIAADVHPSPHRRYAGMMGPIVRGDRYLLRMATMRDMVALIYNVPAGFVTGGPVWLETDEFDIYAKTPPGTTRDNSRPMLRHLLEDRFHLAMHEGTEDQMARVLVVSKEGVKMKQGTGTDDAGCRFKPPPPGSPPEAFTTMAISCHNMTMADFATTLHNFTYDYWPGPINDATDLKGTWTFDLTWSNRSQLAKAGAEGVNVEDAVQKQLGLKFDRQMRPRPVITVDRVDENPTPNAPDLAKILPPIPAPEIEVATIKPSKPDEQRRIMINPGQITANGATLKLLIYFAWDLNMADDEVLVGAPKWLDSDQFDIVAKFAANSDPSIPQIPPEIDEIRKVLRDLLVDRFEIKTHTENRPIDAFNLVATNPKLKKADPTSHTRCGSGPGPGNKDPRLEDPALDQLLVCQNMTMAQIAQKFQEVDPGYINSDVKDATGIAGSWDFTLAYSSSWVTGAGGGLFGPPPPPAAGSDPNGAISFFDAVNKQLGLKLEKTKRSLPVLVIDHIDEHPTGN